MADGVTSYRGINFPAARTVQTECLFRSKVLALLRLKTQAVIAGRLAEMLGAVTAEVRERREVHQVGYLGEGQAFIIQIVF